MKKILHIPINKTDYDFPYAGAGWTCKFKSSGENFHFIIMRNWDDVNKMIRTMIGYIQQEETGRASRSQR